MANLNGIFKWHFHFAFLPISGSWGEIAKRNGKFKWEKKMAFLNRIFKWHFCVDGKLMMWYDRLS